MRFLWNIFPDVAADAVADCVRMIPYLFLAYLLIEWLERHQGQHMEAMLAGGGRWGFVAGAMLGCVPQCGFATFAANLYAGRVITPGTLLAVFLATSDDAVPVIAAEPDRWRLLLVLLIGKVILGVAAGFLLDVPFRRVLPRGLYGGYAGNAASVDCRVKHREDSGIFVAAVRHTLEISAFVLLFNLCLGLAFALIGADTVTALLAGLGPLQPAAAALIGMIPNCAISVLLVQLYLQGAIRFGSLFAGLAAGAGIGLAVLWRVNPSRRQNLFIMFLLWAFGTLSGVLLLMLPI